MILRNGMDWNGWPRVVYQALLNTEKKNKFA
jgi:hypothetical protein